MFGIIASIIIAFLSTFIPGLLLAVALLRKTELHAFEIVVIGIIFGLLGPATMTWLEAYLVNYIHAFSFSLGLFEANAIILTIIGLVIVWRQGILKEIIFYPTKIISSFGSATSTDSKLRNIRTELNNYGRGKEIILRHEEEDKALRARQQSELTVSNLTLDQKETIMNSHKSALLSISKNHLTEERSLLEEMAGSKYKGETKPHWIIWTILLILMLLTFYTRMLSISTAPKFFEFDPYFDMIDTHYILTYGQQLLLDPSAWPVIAAGTNHRIEPIVPYLEAYWYSLVNKLNFHYPTFNINLMSYVGGIYPPITAALLVFIVFMLLYHEYDERIGLIGALFTATMPALISTFIAGEQLVEPWGIMALFFFIAAFMLAIRNMKSKRLAILAGIAFVASFLGAHYYTVTTGVFAAYILVQGTIEIVRGHDLKDFYKMNAIILIIIAIFLVLFLPYESSLQNRIPNILGIPFTISAPLYSLVLIFLFQYIMNFVKKKVKFGSSWMSRTVLLFLLYLIVIGAVLLSPVQKSLNSYINLSARFTTPSKPLFMTVQEYIPTGLLYNFGAQGFGTIGANLVGIPIIVWLITGLSLLLIVLSIFMRGSRTGVLYLAASIPLIVAGFLEVKYLPHFGVAYILLFCIIMGEFLYLIQSKSTKEIKKYDKISPSVYQNQRTLAYVVLFTGLFFIFGAIAPIFLLGYLIYLRSKSQRFSSESKPLVALAFILIVIAVLWPTFRLGESQSITQTLSAAYVYSTNPTGACQILNNNGNGMGTTLFCNTIPQYWLSSMAWIYQNVGPYAPRVLSWWDYGDWINWFGNGNAVLRGDNAVAQEDYAVAAQFVLGGKNATPQTLASYMNHNQSKYVLFDQDLVAKWGALNFLGCININATSMQYAIQQGKKANPPQPYALGTSQCELTHDPEYALVPLSALVNTSTQNINDYCPISNSNVTFINATLVLGNSVENRSVCVAVPQSLNRNTAGTFRIYNSNGTKLNALIQQSQILGVQNIQTSPNGAPRPYILFLMIYLPNSANGTITNAPSGFYTSNFYRGFFTGRLPGFVQVYPTYVNGTNLVNFTQAVRIFQVLNYTGGNAPVPAKPPWIHNNDTMP